MSNSRSATAKRYDELNFAMLEMRLFMDTHPCDASAAVIRNKYENEYKTARRNYIEECGPLTIFDGNAEQWHENPWPWDLEGCAC